MCSLVKTLRKSRPVWPRGKRITQTPAVSEKPCDGAVSKEQVADGVKCCGDVKTVEN